MKKIFCSALLLLSIVCAPFTALAQTCPDCAPSPESLKSEDFQTIFVDASTGTFYTRDANNKMRAVKARYKTRERVRLILLNKNPFRYKYNVVIESTPVAEPDYMAFLKLLLPVEVAAAAKPDADKTSATGGQAATCPNANSGVADAITALSKLINEQYQTGAAGSEVGLRPDFEKIVDSFKATQKKFQDGQKKLQSVTATCSNGLCATAQGLLDTLDKYKPGFDEIEKRINAFKRKAENLEEMVDEYEVVAEDCERPFLRDVELSAKGSKSVADEWLAALKKMRDAKKELDDLAKVIREVLNDPFAFYRVYEIEEFDAATNVTVKFQRKDIVSGDKEFTDFIARFPTLNFGGGPRFTLAAGLSISRLKKQEFQRVQGVVQGQQGLVPIVGLKESSNTRNNFIFMLHSRLFDLGKVPVHFSLGVTRGSDNKGSDPEFLFGPSVSFLNNRLFFTGGGYLGKQQSLEGNLAVGSQVPADLAEIPIRKNNRWGFGFAITYKISALTDILGGGGDKKEDEKK
jgi:hypothetical protein